MRTITLAFALLLAAIALPQTAAAANAASVRALLITASNNKAPADPRLRDYEAELQRNLPESSFRLAGEGVANVAPNGRASINLGDGHRVELQGEGAANDGVPIKVTWLKGNRTFMGGITFRFQPGVPVVLGRRPSGDGEVPIVLVVVR